MTSTTQLSLKNNQALVIPADHLFVKSGVVWLTQSGSADDVLLFAGQSFRRRRSGKVVIQALAEGTNVRLQTFSILSGLRQLISWSLKARISSFRFSARHCDGKASDALVNSSRSG